MLKKGLIVAASVLVGAASLAAEEWGSYYQSLMLSSFTPWVMCSVLAARVVSGRWQAVSAAALAQSGLFVGYYGFLVVVLGRAEAWDRFVFWLAFTPVAVALAVVAHPSSPSVVRLFGVSVLGAVPLVEFFTHVCGIHYGGQSVGDYAWRYVLGTAHICCVGWLLSTLRTWKARAVMLVGVVAIAVLGVPALDLVVGLIP